MSSIAKRESFSTTTATVLTMVGVAVGLGNVWRFPYMMGSHGGSAFLFVYLLFVAFFGLPAVMAEWALGRSTRSGPIGAFGTALGSRLGGTVGVLLTTSVLIANSYYLVVVAMVFYAAGFSAFRGFDATNLKDFGEDLASGPLVGGIALVVLGLGLWLVVAGLRRGIERASKLCVPFFGIVVLYLIFHAMTLPGAGGKFAEFLRPDFGSMTLTNVFAAMGQAIFSLSLGGTFFVIYGSYMRESERIPSTAVWTGLGDVGSALAASLFLVPTMLVFQVDLTQGPSLIFEALPQLFISLPGGRFVGTVFLFAFALMAFLSSVAALQVGMGGLTDRFRLTTRNAVTIIVALEGVLIGVTAFYQHLIPTMDLIFGSAMQCVGCLLACLALSWGLGKVRARSEILGDQSGWFGGLLIFWIRWILPLGIVVVLLLATGPGAFLRRAIGL